MSSAFSETFGPWALVTGASSGIGAAFARRLAARKLNLVLAARRQRELDTLAEALRSAHGVRVETVSVDLSVPNFLDTLRATTDGLDIGLVISNAGAASMGAFLRVPFDDLAAMARLNVTAQLTIAHHYAGRLAERGRGGLLLVSSTAGLQSVPFAANYSAAKSYILHLGEALNAELRPKGVHVTALLPGPTRTPSLDDRSDVDFSKAPMPVQTAEAVVIEGLRALEKNKPSHVSGGMNRMMAGMGRRVMSRRMASGMWGTLMRRVTIPERL